MNGNFIGNFTYFSLEISTDEICFWRNPLTIYSELKKYSQRLCSKQKLAQEWVWSEILETSSIIPLPSVFADKRDDICLLLKSDTIGILQKFWSENQMTLMQNKVQIPTWRSCRCLKFIIDIAIKGLYSEKQITTFF